MKRKFIDDVSISEMQKMREAGMTNQDIANALDVSYQTVYKYIGQQPQGMRKRYARIGAQVKEEEAAHLVVTYRTVELEGEFAAYSICAGMVTINFDSLNESLKLKKEGIETLIAELKEIQRNVDKLEKGSEMW